MNKPFILVLFLSLGLNSLSQTNYSILDLNSTSGIISDGGLFFYDENANQSGYEVPKGSGLKSIYSMGFWFVGNDQNGTLRNSCVRYTSNSDIFSGPFSSTNAYNDPAYMNDYSSSLWTVTRSEILNHQANWSQVGYVMPLSISNWPGNGNTVLGVAANLAPFIDLNNNAVYEPELGDFPDIRGDVATYVIMNDAAAIHTGSNGEQMGIEVHSMFYQYASNDYLDTTTFFNVRVFNRGNYVYDDFKMAIYMDADIGNYSDDYAGCDSLRNLMFLYNGDTDDENNGGAFGYGINPPSIGILSLKQNMQVCGYFTSTSQYPYNDPNLPSEFWSMMRGRWNNGSQWYYGGMGYTGSPGVTSIPTSYMFTGDPESGTGWSEVTNNNPPGDRRIFMVMDSIDLTSGFADCYDYAVLYRRGNSNLNSVTKLKEVADLVQAFYDSQVDFNCDQITVGLGEEILDQVLIYPNPSNGELIINLGPDLSNTEIKIFSSTGQLVQIINSGFSDQVELNLEHSGVYILELKNGSSLRRQKFKIAK